ncbi:MAG: pilus assembly protein PilM [Acidobacteria bacterium]|nr:pilus assembly protein PilM [Acidobacteriota bacterium]NIM60824.1 pilus assembly protein PilM [Acidobacteriota bacterium]NIO58675.1 pilus assembly protein PilM [Acidobacteriota bacterium]NIQ29731.1 pilus assembly protein PilM [Acidobacteriota bacterium]NIQ84455.1 pilus assembly protein PilM [Acidobacteriota bacterium]
MTSLQEIWARLDGTAAAVGLRPAYPPVALDLEQRVVSLVRCKPRRGRKALLEAHVQRRLDDPVLPDSIFQPAGKTTPDLVDRLRELFEAGGTRPGRVSLVLPDNLAKISILQLPERPASQRELDELVRSKMRRAVPFRLDDVMISYQVVPGTGSAVGVLVVLVHRAVVERLESTFEAFGARAGLIDLATPNLINLVRARIDRLGADGGDVALVNCAERYFSLVITRDGQVIFYRCKTFAASADGTPTPNGSLSREVAHSFAYYREKLGGEGIGAVLLRSTSLPNEEVVRHLAGLECERIEPIRLEHNIELADGVQLDNDAAQRLAPAIGAAIARGG